MSTKKVTRAGNPRPPNAGKGRPKGSQNKTTRAAKEAFALAFDGIGGVDALTEWGRDNREEFYKLYARLIPTEQHVTGADGGPLAVEHSAKPELIQEILGLVSPQDDPAPLKHREDDRRRS